VVTCYIAGVDVEWPLMKVIITFTFCCDNLWKSKFMALESLENSGNFFLLLCGHPERVNMRVCDCVFVWCAGSWTRFGGLPRRGLRWWRRRWWRRVGWDYIGSGSKEAACDIIIINIVINVLVPASDCSWPDRHYGWYDSAAGDIPSPIM